MGNLYLPSPPGDGRLWNKFQYHYPSVINACQLKNEICIWGVNGQNQSDNFLNDWKIEKIKTSNPIVFAGRQRCFLSMKNRLRF
jgi:hypothetical protein